MSIILHLRLRYLEPKKPSWTRYSTIRRDNYGPGRIVGKYGECNRPAWRGMGENVPPRHVPQLISPRYFCVHRSVNESGSLL